MITKKQNEEINEILKELYSITNEHVSFDYKKDIYSGVGSKISEGVRIYTCIDKLEKYENCIKHQQVNCYKDTKELLQNKDILINKIKKLISDYE